MVKPFKIFLLLVIILILLCLPSFFFPINGLMLGSIKFHYPASSKLFKIDSTQSASSRLKPEIVFLNRMLDSSQNVNATRDTVKLYSSLNDTLRNPDSLKNDSLLKKTFSIDWLKSKLVKLEFPDSSQKSLHSFFHALRSGECNRTLIRVMHYGDSQIEGDRITSYLRSRLQNQFGGRGIGLIHAVPPSYQPTAIKQSVSSNWEKVTLADHDRNSSGINRYGALGGYSLFTKTNNLFTNPDNQAWIQIQRIGKLNCTARGFNHFKLFYGYNSEPFMIELNAKGRAIDADLIPATSSLSMLSWDINENINEFELKFKGDSSPLIFGISLETRKGIDVDNIPIRGSSGIDFTKTDMEFMKEMLNMLNTKLIILQFGVNVVPNIVDSYKYYEIQFYKQIKALQAAKPNVSIIVIGVSDVSRKEGSEYVSYPNIEKIRDAQKFAAFKAGVPFWDCYKAMGGSNSMAAWVFATPPLASKDFIHFTVRGSNLIAEMFYSALMNEYNTYNSLLAQNTIDKHKAN